MLDTAGDVFWRGTFASAREGIATSLGGFTNAAVVMELGQHPRWASASAQELGHEVIVENPADVPMTCSSNTRGDGLDADALARLARVDRKLFNPSATARERRG